MSTEPTAAIMPPGRQLIFCGYTLEKSKAGETKLATMLMPIVATMKVSAPSTTAKVLSMLGDDLDRVHDQLAEHRQRGRA